MISLTFNYPSLSNEKCKWRLKDEKTEANLSVFKAKYAQREDVFMILWNLAVEPCCNVIF